MDLTGLSEATVLRLAIAAAVLVLLAVIWLTGRKKSDQGVRREPGEIDPSSRSAALAAGFPEPRRREPTFGGPAFTPEDPDEGPGPGSPSPAATPPATGRSSLGARPEVAFDRIVTLFLAARAGETLHGPDIVVACEKAGLAYGHMGIFHRLDDQHPERGPIFSLANLVKPGAFDLERLHEIRTPGLSLFMTLPGPLPALDAWEALLPAAQRMAELLDAVLLDEERNAIGRQRIAHIREEMRAYDRKRDAQHIRF
jgi:cell division protein ZipA